MSDQPAQTPFAGDVVRFTLLDFERALQVAVGAQGIDVRAEEAEDGSRSIHAWKRSNPIAVSVIEIDNIRIGPYQADMIAKAVRKCFS